MLTSFYFQKQSSEVCIKARSTQASLLFQGLVTEHTTVNWSVVLHSVQLPLLIIRNLAMVLPGLKLPASRRASNTRNYIFFIILDNCIALNMNMLNFFLKMKNSLLPVHLLIIPAMLQLC